MTDHQKEKLFNSMWQAMLATVSVAHSYKANNPLVDADRVKEIASKQRAIMDELLSLGIWEEFTVWAYEVRGIWVF